MSGRYFAVCALPDNCRLSIRPYYTAQVISRACYFYNVQVIISIAMKTKGRKSKVAKLELPARVYFGEVPERSNGPVCKTVQGGHTTFAGSNPALSATSISPTRSANCKQGINLGIAPKAGLLRPLSFWTLSPAESNQNESVRPRKTRSSHCGPR